MPGREQGAHSVARRGFGVAPSPFNGVKRELGLILLSALPLWWLISGFHDDRQLALFAVFAVLASLRLAWRTRGVVASLQENKHGQK